MGTDKAQVENKPDIMPKWLFSALLLFGVALLVVFVVLFSKINIVGENEAPKLSPEAEAKLQKRLKEIDEAEQYALVAISNGFYPCLHGGRTTFYLLAGEVWKYGVTSKGQLGRYTSVFLVENKVSYVVQFKGNISECLKQEQIKLYFYPLLPENTARSELDQLPRPPFNPIMR